MQDLLDAHASAGSMTPPPIPGARLPDSSQVLGAGTAFGPYVIADRLGAGGMGEVYRARDTALDRDVAIKVLPDAFAFDTERRNRLQREARLLASLSHPHIAVIHGLQEADGRLALVLELVDGPTLAERLDHGPLPVPEAIAVASQIAAALDAAHESGVIHRDLKPANIKLSPGRGVKVLDFGLAKAAVSGGADLSQLPTVTSDGTRDGTILGTVGYMSPEQARGHAVDKRTDIWAFGCVVYDMLTARRAFPGATLSDTIVSILEREPDWTALPAATPSSLRRLLRRCLEKDPRQRLRDMGDAVAELTDVPADRLAPAAADRVSLSPMTIAAAVVGLVAASAVVTWLTTRTVAPAGSAPGRGRAVFDSAAAGQSVRVDAARRRDHLSGALTRQLAARLHRHRRQEREPRLAASVVVARVDGRSPAPKARRSCSGRPTAVHWDSSPPINSNGSTCRTDGP